MKSIKMVIVVALLTLTGTPVFALTSQQAECVSALHGGVCQVSLGDLAGGEKRVISVDLSAQCFPRIVNYRLSRNQTAQSGPPFGAWVALSGVSATEPDFHEDGVGEVTFFVRNERSHSIEHVWLGFVWECESAF